MRNKQAGSTLVELIVVVALLGLGLGMAAVHLRPIESPLRSGATLVESFLRQARMNAMATTSAYRVSPNGTRHLQAESAPSCGASSWTLDTGMSLRTPDGVTFDATDWSICFTSRGVSATNLTITLNHPVQGSIDVEVLLGGTTRVIP